MRKKLKKWFCCIVLMMLLSMLNLPANIYAKNLTDEVENLVENEATDEVVDEAISDSVGTTQSEFDNKLNELRGQYPNYSVWNDWFDGGHQCFGFARLIGYNVFGTKPSTWGKGYNINEVKSGDLIQYGNTSGSGHTVFVTNVSGDTITFVDCNGNGNYSGGNKVRSNGVKWDNTIKKSAKIWNKYSFSYILVSPGISPAPAPDPSYNSYGFDCPLNNETITASTFLFQGWLDTKKQISSITCSINHGAHYVETGLYQRPDVPNATAFRVEVDSNLLNIGKNDIALCANFQDGTATVVENRTVIWNPKLLWGYDSPTENMSIDDNSFQFSGWIETSRRLEKVTCSLNQGEQYITANLYQRPDVPNAIAFRADIDSSLLHYGDNYVSVCAHYADGTGETLAMRKVKNCISDALEYPQNNEIFTCKNTWFLLQGWSTNDNKSIDYFEFTLNGQADITAAHPREDLIKNARYYRVEVPLNRLKNGGNRIEVFVHYTDKTSRRIAQVNVIGESLEHKWNEGEITKESTCTDVGIKTYTCTNCKETRIEEIPAAGHQHTEIRNEKQATTDEEGYTGDVYCIDCNQLISKGTSIPKLIPMLSLVEKNGIFIASVSNTKYVIEYGFVYGNQSDITLETPGRTRVAYSDLDSNGSYSFDATELTGCTIRAYAVYTDEDGAAQVIYSDSINPDPSYTDFSVSQSVYSLHDKIEFRINPINATNMGFGIDKDGVGRVVTGVCNATKGHSLWASDLGVGSYSAYITVYNGSKWVDTNVVKFSVVPPEYSNLSINKKRIEINEKVQFNISTGHTAWMGIGIDKEGVGRVYGTSCGDSVSGWSVDAGILGVGNYTAYFTLYGTNDCYVDTERVSFSIYDPDGP